MKEASVQPEAWVSFFSETELARLRPQQKLMHLLYSYTMSEAHNCNYNSIIYSIGNPVVKVSDYLSGCCELKSPMQVGPE